MTVWIEYERSRCLHEVRPGYLEHWEVQLPRLSGKEYRWDCGYLVKYEDKAGRVRWKSLDYYRRTFRSGYTTREQAAQELVTECPFVVRMIERRQLKVASMPLSELAVEARNARV